jgi:hypothetical protein
MEARGIELIDIRNDHSAEWYIRSHTTVEHPANAQFGR